MTSPSGSSVSPSGICSAITASSRAERPRAPRHRCGGGWPSSAHLPDQKGLVIEPKRHSITVHYRHVRDKRRVLELLAEAAHSSATRAPSTVPRPSTFFPNNGAHKGLALQQACRAFACDTAIYIGDDDTDEDAFASAGPERLLSIRVGTKRPSIAQYRLKSQSDIDDLMKLLVDLGAVLELNPGASRRFASIDALALDRATAPRNQTPRVDFVMIRRMACRQGPSFDPGGVFAVRLASGREMDGRDGRAGGPRRDALIGVMVKGLAFVAPRRDIRPAWLTLLHDVPVLAIDEIPE